MSRIMLIGLCASAFLIASALVSPAIETEGGPIVSNAAHAYTNLNSSRSNRTSKPDHYTKRGKQGGGGGPAGIAVSDPGAEGTKPVKGKKH
jgi:hypothetical protein